MKFLYSRTSIKYLQKLERGVVRKIIESIEKLPFEGNINKLEGKKAKNIFRLRIEKFRVIYLFEKGVIKISGFHSSLIIFSFYAGAISF